MRAFDVCLEISSDSKNYFGFVVDEFSKRGHTVKRIINTSKYKRRYLGLIFLSKKYNKNKSNYTVNIFRTNYESHYLIRKIKNVTAV